ncbi:MAG: hypothetical protein E7539_07550 [Ruminococcaceae bacterium]|nr:hypothetical protein [Oscillospiraceae bacterium]
MTQRRISRRKILRSGLVVLSIILVAAITLLFIDHWDKRQGGLPWQDLGDTTEQTVRYNGQWYVLKDNIDTVLVMGLDKFEADVQTDSYNNDRQADFLALLIIDRDEDKATAIHLNRDAMAKMNVLGIDGDVVDTTTAQLALAHTYGSGGKDSCENTADAVSNFLYEVPVEHYISLTMDAVATLNDLVGGVTVTVLDDFSGVDDTLVKGQEVTLKGQQALTYVRNRKGIDDETNAHRMLRQQQYMKELFAVVTEKVDSDEGFLKDAAREISDYMVSDCTVSQLERIASFVSKHDISEIKNIEGKSEVGEKFMEFYPDEDKLQAMIIDLFFKPKK